MTPPFPHGNRPIRRARTGPRRSSGAAGQLILGGLFVAGLMFALPTMLVLSIGLLPTLVAMVVDSHPRRYAARAVGAMNVAGILPFLVGLWQTGHGVVSAMEILTDVFAWLVIYSAAALGWLLHLGMPEISGLLMQISSRRRIRRLEARQRRLISEWGPEVGGEIS